MVKWTLTAEAVRRSQASTFVDPGRDWPEITLGRQSGAVWHACARVERHLSLLIAVAAFLAAGWGTADERRPVK